MWEIRNLYFLRQLKTNIKIGHEGGGISCLHSYRFHCVLPMPLSCCVVLWCVHVHCLGMGLHSGLVFGLKMFRIHFEVKGLGLPAEALGACCLAD